MTPCLDATRSDDLRDWLLYSPIQLESGEHRGGLAGWLDGGERATFVYGEATGYYLSCGRFMGGAGGGPLRARLAAAENWLHAIWQAPPPPTRHYLNGGPPDWRNSAVFTFDCAMMLRGLHTYEGDRVQRTSAAIAAQLAQAIGPDGTLACYVPREGAGPLPKRWSTEPGPFQLKTAAAILSAPGLPARLKLAAEATALRWLEWYRTAELAGDLHPLLYHLEGLLIWGSLRRQWTWWRLATDVFGAVMARQRDDGTLPASLDDPLGPARGDVLAQALRIGCLLDEGGFLTAPGWARRLEDLAASLGTFIDPSGGVLFQRDAAERHVNVWCTVFAYQALSLFERRVGARTLDEGALTAIA